jgi:CysZ protein
LSIPILVLLGVAVLLAAMMLGLGLALLATAPLLDALSRRAERRARGEALEAGGGWRFEVVSSLKGAVWFTAAAPVALLIGLVPVLGPVAATLWAGYALSFQLTDGPLTRRGLDFAAKRRWHRYWRLESLGFGLGGLVTLIVPVLNLLVAPALVVGATRLVLELGTRVDDAGEAVRQHEASSGQL